MTCEHRYRAGSVECIQCGEVKGEVVVTPSTSTTLMVEVIDVHRSPSHPHRWGAYMREQCVINGVRLDQ